MPYDSFSPNFAVLGDLPQVYRQGQVANARRSLGDLAPTDYSGMAQRLIAAGDIEGATSLARLGDAGFHRQMEERKLKLAEEAAHEKPTVQVVEDASGNKQLVRVEPYARGASVITPQGSQAPTNPFSSGKQTEAQSKDSLYASRMFQSESVLRDPKVLEAATSSKDRAGAAIAEKVPFGLGNQFVHPDYQRFDQAQRDFINSVLRRESGAAIAESEFVNARKQYFPVPGDSKEVIAQKQRNRAEAIKGVAGGGGPAYRPPFTFDEQGGMVPNRPQGGAVPAAAAPAPAGGAARPASKADYDALPAGSTYVAPDGSTRTKK